MISNLPAVLNFIQLFLKLNRSRIGENRQVVTNEPVEFEK